ncbi:MAG: uroporphyrinogen-III C-methyltransferase [Magnetococcales bacterium]|nr:uroporphyrinogen-III C-methyltransferase [Magnetococcales bacterium]
MAHEIMVDKSYLEPGTVALTGAGPGDPDLLTLAAYKAIQSADVVVHDALVSPEILDMIPEGCRKVHAGKRGGGPSANQNDISDTLVSLAQEGLRVVRLKGGDPFIFGRGGEEAARLAGEGIRFRVVPGLSAGAAGPAYAGIPVTHRSVNANVAFITGHEKAEGSADPGISRIDWESVGKAFPVLVLFMAMQNLHLITQRLIKGGRDHDTPVAIIRWATTKRQQTLVSTLAQAVDDVASCGIKPPAIIVIGDVVRYRKELAWFPDESFPCAAS